jgi:Protein of unknown function (DUF3039)
LPKKIGSFRALVDNGAMRAQGSSDISAGIFDRGLPTLDGPVISADTDTLTKPVEQEDDGGHDRFAHYIKKEKIVESAVTGKKVRALCGKKWVPSRDPQKYPVCPICKEIFEGLRPGPEDKD